MKYARTDGSTGERGQTLVEYALIILLIALVIIVSLVAFRVQLSSMFSTIASSLA